MAHKSVGRFKSKLGRLVLMQNGNFTAHVRQKRLSGLGLLV